MRPQDILMPVPAGLCCKPGGFHIDPVRPVERAVITHGHSDHARARPRRRAGDAGDARHDAAALRRELRRLDAGDRYGETVSARRRHGDIPSRRSRARLGAGRGRAATAPASSPRATTRTRPIRPARRSRLVRCDVFITEATFGLPVFRHGDAAARSRKLLASVALFPERAHLVGAYSLGKAQRVIALIRAGRLRRADLSARRDGEDHRLLRRARHRARRAAPGQGREEGRARRHHHAGAAVGDRGPLDAALSRSGHRLRVRLDAGARPGAAARRRAAAGDFRPRRLGRADRHHRGHRRRRNLGHPRPGRRAGALVHDARD